MLSDPRVKAALIVGGSRGIGKQLVSQLKLRGWSVTEASRTGGRTLTDASRSHRHVDIGDPLSVGHFAEELSGCSFDLIHVNSGTLGNPRVETSDVTRDESSELFFVNAIGPVKLAKRVVHLLRPNGILAFTSSAMASLNGYDTRAMPIYRATKAALNSLSRDFYLEVAEKRRITVLNLHPGWVQTDMGGMDAPLTPEQSATGLINVIQAERPDGHFFLDYEGATLSW
ncbi:NAD(P)-dependent dehydrogenase, short-chain alcohol dehydrogenase family [Rhizobium sp. NFR07]|uniref:SDR family NAD(P)-dependent oxidoreductase n=1 Tax=Rhizobium sp. NFR07 TaxID=1566262 RepID=UPI0008F035D1|nr:SDR family NAD(P)-dependent oxidoreductase [Rhizobium sp. NFR07]SFB61684.1 NAD(P)-dependent dehydrogenase, short-chain alcohol dehydrogenase family [Rhizobium sp. NFR07]